MFLLLEKPQIIDIQTSSDSTLEEGDSYTLECAAGGIPQPRISWQMAGSGILPTGGRVLQVSPPHDKTNKMICVHSEDIRPVWSESLQPHEETLGP